MLTITIPSKELYDEVNNKFSYTQSYTIELEHSLVSLSKWESKWKKSFLSSKDRSNDETLDYIRCMCLTPGVPEEVFMVLSDQNIKEVSEYINDKMTATWFNEQKGQRSNSEIITAEIIYYWLVALQIDWRVETWHLNRLLTLVRVTNIKNDPKQKMMPRAEAAKQQRDLNAERKAQMNTKG